MARVFIFGMLGVIVVGLVIFAIVGVSGASRLGEGIQNIGRKKKRKAKKKEVTGE